MKYAIKEGYLGGTLPYFAMGQGEPLLFVRTVTPDSGNPTGAARWAELRALKAYADTYTVYAVSRDPKAVNVDDMAAFAAQYARAMQKEFSGPVRIMGISTGGSLALQIAADYPKLVKQLAVIAASCRLSDQGKAVQAKYADFLSKHDQRNAEKTLAPLITKTKLGSMLMGGVLWLTAPLAGKPEYRQMVTFLHAEDTFDLANRLQNIQVPTLFIAGDRDKVYNIDDIRLMAAEMPHATLKIYNGADHRQVIANPSVAKEVRAFFKTT